MSRFGGGVSRFGGGFQQQQQQPQYGSGGGGGGDYDPSDLGGGGGDGFNGTQDGGASPRSPKRSGAIVQTLTPVTVRQLHLATHSHPDDIFKVDDRELNQITLVGQIVNLQVQSTNVELEVDDGTGKIGVRMWLDVEDERDPSRRWDVGSYVRVIGNLRSFMDTRSVLAFRVMPIEKYDEVTYHFLDVIHVHLAVTKGDLQGDASATSTAASGRSTGYDQSRGNSGAQRGGYGRQAAPAAQVGGFNPAQKAVLEVIRSTSRQHGSAGCALGEVVEVLQSMYSDDDIRDAVEWLTAEGHLFTAGDDFYRCSE